MDAVLTVRLDPAIKSQGSAVMERLGTTPSKAVRELFDFAVRFPSAMRMLRLVRKSLGASPPSTAAIRKSPSRSPMTSCGTSA